MYNSASYILDFSSISEKDYHTVGNKAFNLAKLIQNNFNVPNGFVIKTTAYQLFLEHNNLKMVLQDSLELIDYDNYEILEKCSEKIQREIEGSKLPQKLVNELKEKYNFYKFEDLAVRSSATAEDLPNLSFAGQYSSFLNLRGIDQILEYIKKCYSSLWTSRAISYRKENNIPHNSVELAIIIQKVIPAKISGVLFTQNPISVDPSEFLIESNFGLGESVMSGTISPDQYIVRANKVIDMRIGKKEIAVQPKSSEEGTGTESIKLDNNKSMESSLNDHQIAQLVDIGSQIENLYKKVPQDIEWAIDDNNIIYILQTRPITSLRSGRSFDDTIWSRGYSDDYWNDPVTPLFFELLGDQLTKIVNIELNDIMGYKKMESQLLKLYNGHVYFNLKVLRRKLENEIPGFLRNDDIMNYFPDGSGFYGKETIKNLPFHLIKRLVAEIRIMLYDPDGSISKTANKYESWTNEIFIPFCQEFDNELIKLEESNQIIKLFELAKDLDRVMIGHFRLVRYGIPVHNIGMNLLSQYLLKRFLGSKEALRYFPILISGLNHKLTETNNSIHHLSSIIQNNSDLKSLFLQKNSDSIYESLISEKNKLYEDFLNEFNKFIIDYGDRGFTREPFYPRWCEKPMTKIFDILKSLILEEKRNFKYWEKDPTNLRNKIEKIVEIKIRSQRFGFIKWKFLSAILKLSRTYIIFRENQRFNLDRWISRNRKVFLEIGKLFIKKGILKEPNDIFFLKKKEIKDLIFDKVGDQELTNLKSCIKIRSNDFLKYENVLPPKFLQGTLEFNDKLRYTQNNKIFRGIPASQGIATGLIRILNKIEQIPDIKAGEILVVSRTDPGWTPIFSKISGLITETGGILSHGAVVSREYSIAAVINIPNACSIFRTGQKVTINGYTGIINIEN
jgi:phosphohistidine swiveling domain-containing protein